MNATTIGLDIAKNVFQVHGVDGSARLALARARRDVAASTTFDGLDRATGSEAHGDVDGLEVVQPKPAQ